VTELATLPIRPAGLLDAQTPDEVVTHAQHVANTLAAVIKRQKLAVTIGGRPYVRVEGWTLLGAMLGISQNTVWSRPTEDGWEARVEAFSRDGRLLGSGEAMCTRGEKSWKNRDEYALRSMAQTRAVSKALRQPLGFVISLAGYEATPAEEMPTEDPAPAPPEYPARPDITMELASDAQVKNIFRLLNKIEKAGTATRDQLLERMGASNGTERPVELTKQQAMKVINDLKELAGEE
jgi:hypothetical protein